MGKSDLDELIEQSENAIEKGEDLSDFEAEHHHKVKPEAKDKKTKIDDKIKEKKYDSIEKTDEKTEDIETINEIKPKSAQVRPASSGKSLASANPPAGKAGATVGKKAKVRSKKYTASKELIDSKKTYELDEAIELVRKTSYTKFIGNVEVHIRMLGKSGKPEQVRGLINYPHSTGKKINVVILDDKTIEEISKTSKAPADMYLATPELMPRVGRLAKILGPKGKMPNPKAGTVTIDPKKTKSEMEAGQTEYKTDSYGIIHQVIGKVSAKNEELIENYKELISALAKDHITSINLCATMGPGIKVKK